MKKTLNGKIRTFFAYSCFLTLLLSLNGCKDYDDSGLNYNWSSSDPKVIFSHEAGFYDREINLELISAPGNTIYYTTDSSMPSKNNPGAIEYTGPILIERQDPSHAPLSQNLIVDMRFNSEYSPPSRVRRATVIKAVAATPDGTESDIFSNTYFIDVLKDSDHNMGFVSVSGSPYDLFDPDAGIYYKIHSNDYRTTVHVEYFDEERERLFVFDAETRVFGGFTRNFAQKSLKLIFTRGFERQKLRYPIFGDFSFDVSGETIDTFGRLRLHSGGNDSKHTTFIDGMIMDLSRDMDIAINPFLPVITFINGEYWGLYAFREDYKSDFFEERYPVDYDDVIALKIVWGCDNVPDVTTGTDEDLKTYYEMHSFLEENDFSDDEIYNLFINRYIDESSFIDFYIANIYVNNIDWLGNNVRMWRTRQADPSKGEYYDGRFRYILHDVDAGMKDRETDLIEILLREEDSGIPETQPFDYWATLMFRRLAQNPAFVEKFTNRMLYHLNGAYEKSHVLDVLDEYSRRQEPSVMEHKVRWGQLFAYPYRQAVRQVRLFIETRHEILLDSLNRNMGTGRARKIHLSGFSRLDHAYAVFGDEKLLVSDRERDFDIYAFEGTSIEIADNSNKVKGYIVSENGIPGYVSGERISIDVRDTSIIVIPVTFSLYEYLLSSEGITLASFFIVLVLIIFIKKKKQKRKNIESW